MAKQFLNRPQINTHFKKTPPAKGKPNLKIAPKKSGNKISQ